jgi:ethanolamine transporter EutH
MISFLITLLVVVIILGLIYWVTTQIPLPHPFGRIVQVVIVVVGVLIIVMMLLGLIGYAPVPYPLR